MGRFSGGIWDWEKDNSWTLVWVCNLLCYSSIHLSKISYWLLLLITCLLDFIWTFMNYCLYLKWLSVPSTISNDRLLKDSIYVLSWLYLNSKLRIIVYIFNVLLQTCFLSYSVFLHSHLTFSASSLVKIIRSILALIFLLRAISYWLQFFT